MAPRSNLGRSRGDLGRSRAISGDDRRNGAKCGVAAARVALTRAPTSAALALSACSSEPPPSRMQSTLGSSRPLTCWQMRVAICVGTSDAAWQGAAAGAGGRGSASARQLCSCRLAGAAVAEDEAAPRGAVGARALGLHLQRQRGEEGVAAAHCVADGAPDGKDLRHRRGGPTTLTGRRAASPSSR